MSTIYQGKGYKNRAECIKHLAETYNIAPERVREIDQDLGVPANLYCLMDACAIAHKQQS